MMMTTERRLRYFPFWFEHFWRSILFHFAHEYFIIYIIKIVFCKSSNVLISCVCFFLRCTSTRNDILKTFEKKNYIHKRKIVYRWTNTRNTKYTELDETAQQRHNKNEIKPINVRLRQRFVCNWSGVRLGKRTKRQASFSRIQL